MHHRDKVTRIRELIAQGQEITGPSLTTDDTLGRVLRAAAPWGVRLVRIYMASGFAVMAWGFWFFFRFNHRWAFIKWTVSQRPADFFAWPFMVAVPLGLLLTLMVFLVSYLVRHLKRRRIK